MTSESSYPIVVAASEEPSTPPAIISVSNNKTRKRKHIKLLMFDEDSPPLPASKVEKTSPADEELDHLYETLDLSDRSKRKLERNGVDCIDALIKMKAELRKSELPVNSSTQARLYEFCCWYEYFMYKHGASVNWVPQFTENTLSASGESSRGILDADLELVCEELEIPKKVRLELAALSITSVEDILGRETQLELFSLAGVKKTLQKVLLSFCLWFKSNQKSHGTDALWKDHFSNEAVANLVIQDKVEEAYRTTLGKLQEGRHDGGINTVSEDIINFSSNLTTRFMNSSLKEEVKGKFDPYYVSSKTTRALMHPTGEVSTDTAFEVFSPFTLFSYPVFLFACHQPCETIHLVSGKTQAGKSSVKAVVAAVHQQLQCLLIIITKGTGERDELKRKINRLLGACGDVLFLHSNGRDIGKGVEAVKKKRLEQPNVRWGIIVDECDDMYRTEHGTQITEQKYKSLMMLKPSFRMEVSATIYSAVLALTDQGKNVDIMQIHTTDDYSGVEDMAVFKNAQGNPAYMNIADIRHDQGCCLSSAPARRAMQLRHDQEGATDIDPRDNVIFKDGLGLNPTCFECRGRTGCRRHTDVASTNWVPKPATRHIPCTDNNMMRLLEQQLTNRSKRGVLVLVATNNRVYAVNNVIDQATAIQDTFRDKGADFVAVVFTGRGTEIRLPGKARGRFLLKKLLTPSQTIEKIDDLYGLDTPIVVFGYSRLCRSSSFRSTLRVPTAIMLNRSKNYSLEDYIQGIGRATFNGKSILKENGHDCVIVYTNDQDFTSTMKYYNFLKEIKELMQNSNTSYTDALRRIEKKFPGKQLPCALYLFECRRHLSSP